MVSLLFVARFAVVSVLLLKFAVRLVGQIWVFLSSYFD